ncbi:50S ribosomal protein L17 [Texas Phoenix palm phytoplasma]|uniref:Large ribosomal subunit protein bL17 n=1 Tax=Texas Phoenix palm phytoplasma TaxID=176709 RepID=A0ABS5BII7_9MOLU|nr:50S ribosomal protein L17 [Texas Phoenix palm phytoplasma]MBP3059392.1 50S ribosomal protein L17 [Texas Phoenix palm phytoplasma]
MAYSKLRRNSSQRKALLRNLVSNLIKYEKIFTTESKAKEASKIIDKLITLSKKNTLDSRRRALIWIYDGKVDEKKTILQKLFTDISLKYQNRKSGYTRVLKSTFRRGDSSNMAWLFLV